MRRVYLLTFLLLGMVLSLLPAKLASADHQYLWWDEYGDKTFASFGANSYITINTGQMEYVSTCPQGGTNDFLYPATDAYIVPSGSVSEGSELEDVSGEPSTIISPTSQGMFIYEDIGITAPSGTVGEGKYAVVYDECQDGKVDAIDFVLDPAFEVRAIPTDVPPLPSIEAEKALAGIAGQELEDLHEWLDDWFKAQTALDPNPLNRMLYGMGTTPLTAHPAHIVLIQVANQAKHYRGIEADPPDPNFQQISPLLTRESVDLRTNDPLLLAMADLGTESSSESALAEALLRSLERYQGADQKGNGTWALVHARAIQDYSLQLQAQLSKSSDALKTLDDALAADTTPLDANAADVQAFIERVRASGFTEDEVREALNLGLTYEEIGDLDSAVSALDLSTFSKANLRGAIADLRANNSSLVTELKTLATDMQSNITTLEADPLVANKAPTASGGGPYTGNEGTAITFDASLSTSPSSITKYEWDLDGDGAYDDATGATPSKTYNEAFEGLIGVRVTNTDNLQHIGYARLEVEDVNRRPVISSTSPVENTVVMDAGTSKSFAVTATDPDADSVSIEWFVDGVSAGTGASFAYNSTSTNVGLHVVEARVGDDHALGGEVRRKWGVAVLVPDADADGYRANADCDDSDASINPGQTEIIGNGKDDDCNPATPDAGTPPAAKFTAAPTVAIVGEAVQFTDGSTDLDSQIVAWAWEFGDGGTSTLQSPSHTYNTAGSYTVKLTVTDEHGNASSATKAIKATSAPKAEFTVPAGLLVVDKAIQFTDASSDPDGNIVAWSWDLGDGTTSTEQNPAHIYAVTGKYTVRLTVTDNDGASSSVTQDLTIVAPPKAFFSPDSVGRNVALLEGGASIHSYSSQSSLAYQAQTLINYSPNDSYWATGKNALTNQWMKIVLAGGKTYVIDRVRLMPASHSTERVSEFEVAVSTTTADDAAFTTVLTATAANNTTLQEFVLPKPVLAKYVLYRPLKNRGSTCCIGTQQLKVFTGQEGGRTVKFVNDTTDADNDVVSWLWDFGDGTTSTDQSPTHTYPEGSATYTVKLTVIDAEGQSDTFMLNQTVLTPPVASFTFTPMSPNEGQRVVFTDTSTDPDGGTILASRVWQWGDGTNNTGTTKDFSHTFRDNGSYTVTLRVVDSQELTSEVQQTVTTVNLPPTVGVGVDQTLVWGQNLAMTPSMNDAGAVDRLSLVCKWDFRDGRTVQVSGCNATNARVAHAYANPGTYTASLTVTDKDGASAKDSLRAVVQKRDTFSQALSARNLLGGQVEVSARLYDRYIWAGVPNKPLTFTAGSATATVSADASGIATVTLPRGAGVDMVSVSFAGDTHYNGSSMERPIEAPFGDIVFMIDESGSMGEDQNDVRRRITDIALQLGSKLDFQLGLVGYGASEKGGAGHIQTTLTKDIGTYTRELDKLETSGGFEPGFNATVVGMSDAMNFRQNAGTCAILITDEDADISAQIPTTKAEALAALWLRNAIFLGIVGTGGTTVDDYGPNPGSLAEATGGQVFSIGDFRRDPVPVLTAIIEKCVKRIATPDLELAKSDGQETVQAGSELTYTLTVANHSTGNATSISLKDTLPAGTSFVSASDGGTLSSGVVTWPVFDLAAGETATRTVVVNVESSLATGDQIVNTASVADDGTNGPDPTPANNTATDTDTVEAPANAAPAAQDQSVSTDEDTAVDVVLTASDADNDPLTFSVLTQPAHGKLSGTAPNLTYTPDADYSGPDSFTFTVNDGTVDSTVATVSITVRPVNDKPVATNDSATTPEDEALTLGQAALLGNDTDVDNATPELSVRAVSNATRGKVELLEDGSVRFTPETDYYGPAGFDYTLSDGGLTDTAHVVLTVTPVNDPPTAAKDSKVTEEDKALTFPVVELLTNDSAGPDNESEQRLIVAEVTATDATHGTVALIAGEGTYTPEANYNGEASFAYKVCDDGQTNGTADPRCVTGTVNVAVAPINDKPKAAASPATLNIAEDSAPQTVVLTGSDVETADADLRFTITAAPKHGALEHKASVDALAAGDTFTGSPTDVTYTPDADYNGTDGFSFKVTDTGDGASAALDSNVVTVDVSIEAVNDAPLVTDNGPSQEVQYSDPTELVTISATDIDSPMSSLTASTTWKKQGDTDWQTTEPLGGLSLSAVGATSADPRAWELGGRTLVPRGTYVVRVAVADGQDTGHTDVIFEVGLEDTKIEYSGDTLKSTGSTSS
ncbi:MAG: PKD domain-containing protein, partial [Chloroflexota bacterium]|nr:PKD domain-containing protein [Chloroflexota bacterium]